MHLLPGNPERRNVPHSPTVFIIISTRDGCLEILVTVFFFQHLFAFPVFQVQLASESCALVPRKTCFLLVNSYVYRLFCHLCEGALSYMICGFKYTWAWSCVWCVVCCVREISWQHLCRTWEPWEVGVMACTSNVICACCLHLAEVKWLKILYYKRSLK
jgi:hypothetical protein